MEKNSTFWCGNTTTKDKVIRRELAINPGEVFDMVSVELSKRRLEGTGLFDKVDTQVERIEELPNKRNLVIGVTEGRTANLMMGFGYGSIMSLYGQIGFTQGNFDLFNPPYFTGGGQKFRLQITAGRRHEDYMVTFEEPYFLDLLNTLKRYRYFQYLQNQLFLLKIMLN